MNRKNLSATVIIVLVVILASIFAYVNHSRRLSQPAISTTNDITSEQQSSPAPETANKTIIYANAQVDKADDHEPLKNIDFYSAKLDGSSPTKLFSLSADEVNEGGLNDLHFKFCPTTQKVYLLGSKNEIDLKGNVRGLDFMQVQDPKLKSLEFVDTGFILSPDCSKVVWGHAYDAGSPSSHEDIYISDLNGNNKRLLLDIKKNEGNKIRLPYRWSTKHPDLVYLTDYDWDGNGGGGGLYTLDTASGKIRQIPQVPLDGIVNDISSDENKIVYGANPIVDPNDSEITVLNLIDNTKSVFTNDSNGKNLFSPSSDKLADVVSDCSGEGDKANCTSDLYVFANGQNKKIASGTDLMGWLSEDGIIGSRSNALVGLNDDGSEIKNIATANDNLFYIGMLN